MSGSLYGRSRLCHYGVHGVIDLAAELIGYQPDTAGDVGNELDLLIELEYRRNRHDDIYYEYHAQYRYNTVPDRPVHEANDLHYRRMEHEHSKRTRDAPIYRKAKADKSVKIKFVIRIIPPPQMEDPVKDNTCYKLYHGTYDRGAEEKKREIMSYRLEEPDNTVESYSVYRAVRTVKKSSVDELTLGNAVIDNLHDPSDKSVDKEHYHGFQE